MFIVHKIVNIIFSMNVVMMLCVRTEIKIGVSTGKSIPDRLKFSSLSSDGMVGRLEGRKTPDFTDRQKVSRNQMKY